MKYIFLMFLTFSLFSCSSSKVSQHSDYDYWNQNKGSIGENLTNIIKQNLYVESKIEAKVKIHNKCLASQDINYKPNSVNISYYKGMHQDLLFLKKEELSSSEITKLKFLLADEELISAKLQNRLLELNSDIKNCFISYIERVKEHQIALRQKQHFVKIAKNTGRNVSSVENDVNQESEDFQNLSEEEISKKLNDVDQINENDFVQQYDDNAEAIVDENQQID